MGMMKIIGFFFSIIVLGSVSYGLYYAGSSKIKIIDRFKISPSIEKKMRYALSDDRFNIQRESLNWGVEGESAKAFFPKVNPCQINWIMTLNSYEAGKYHTLYYLNPSPCKLNKEEIYYTQVKIFKILSRQYDFLKVDEIHLATDFYLDDLSGEKTNAKNFIESVIGKKLKTLGNGRFSVNR